MNRSPATIRVTGSGNRVWTGSDAPLWELLPSWPTSLAPRHDTAPAPVSQHTKLIPTARPTASDATLVASGSPAPEPQHHRVWPASIAQVESPEAATLVMPASMPVALNT